MKKSWSAWLALIVVLFWSVLASAQQLAGVGGGTGTLAIELKIPSNIVFAWTVVGESNVRTSAPVRVSHVYDPDPISCRTPAQLAPTQAEVKGRQVSPRDSYAALGGRSVVMAGLPESLTATWRPLPAQPGRLPQAESPIGDTQSASIRVQLDEGGTTVEHVFLDLMPAGEYTFNGFGINAQDGVRWWVDPFKVTIEDGTVSQRVTLRASILTDFRPVVVQSDKLCFGPKTRECLVGEGFEHRVETNVVERNYGSVSQKAAPAFTFEGCTQPQQLEFSEAPGVVNQYAGSEVLIQCTTDGAQEKVIATRGKALRPVVSVYSQLVTINARTGKQTLGEVRTHLLRVGDPFTLQGNTYYKFGASNACLRDFNATPSMRRSVAPPKAKQPVVPAPRDKKPPAKQVPRDFDQIIPSAP